ncbi:membrane-associated protein, putative [Bodo saltans]|uniref:Membrane-associated protein, putative n=1 Tax=Bodo saltans TaxID=75058 RepID=A0A0S4ILZ4_BODSA|nr:membrane-associated protein, putative [Bodo saltans]|eukprot:CUE71767.1 membrane-associated protein, putative [Bodo saltans]
MREANATSANMISTKFVFSLLVIKLMIVVLCAAPSATAREERTHSTTNDKNENNDNINIMSVRIVATSESNHRENSSSFRVYGVHIGSCRKSSPSQGRRGVSSTTVEYVDGDFHPLELHDPSLTHSESTSSSNTISRDSAISVAVHSAAQPQCEIAPPQFSDGTLQQKSRLFSFLSGGQSSDAPGNCARLLETAGCQTSFQHRRIGVPLAFINIGRRNRRAMNSGDSAPTRHVCEVTIVTDEAADLVSTDLANSNFEGAEVPSATSHSLTFHFGVRGRTEVNATRRNGTNYRALFTFDVLRHRSFAAQCSDSGQTSTLAPPTQPTSAPSIPPPTLAQCTNAANCNNHATSWSGVVGSCSCTCDPAWTDATCGTSNVCTNCGLYIVEAYFSLADRLFSGHTSSQKDFTMLPWRCQFAKSGRPAFTVAA